MLWTSPSVGLTTAEAARKLGVRDDTVKKWAARGWLDRDGQRRKLTVVSVDERGVRRFRFADLLAAEKATRRHPNSRRRPVEVPA